MSIENKVVNSQRNTNYRAMIPFYILWDLDLNANHLRLYGQIEQMESNPNPDVCPTFSYEWLAQQIGTNMRNAKRLAKTLKEKGYIERYMITQNEWGWRTVKSLDEIEVIKQSRTTLKGI